MPAGRDLLKGTPARPLKVWYWNLEDPREEIDRRIAAIMLHYKIHPGEITLSMPGWKDPSLRNSGETRSKSSKPSAGNTSLPP
jgi:hypothetical protein